MTAACWARVSWTATAVECPRHGGRFDLFSGRVLALPPVRPVNAYPAHVEDGLVVVDLP